MYYQQTNVEKINEGHTAIYELVEAEEFDKAADLMRIHLQNDMVFALNAYKEYQERKSKIKTNRQKRGCCLTRQPRFSCHEKKSYSRIRSSASFSVSYTVNSSYGDLPFS